MDYDFDYEGNFGIDAYWIDSKKNIKQRIDLMVDSLSLLSTKIIKTKQSHSGVFFIDFNAKNPCGTMDRFIDETVEYYGTVRITRYDLQFGIISASFEFTLYKPGCDTIKVTHGRFDKKL